MLDLPAPSEGDEVLGQPSRARLFAALSELRRPATTAELADAVGLRPNGVRVQLAALERAGLVARARTEGRRGRPADLWAVSAQARPAGRSPSAYQQLSGFLARAIAAGASEPTEMRVVGRMLGQELAGGGGAAGDDVGVVEGGGAAGVESGGTAGVESGGTAGVEHAFAAMGFAPRRARPRGRGSAGSEARTVFRLCNCPYRDAVVVNQPAVCALHHGISEGLVETLMPTAQLAGFVVEEPRRAGCLVEIAEATGMANSPSRVGPVRHCCGVASTGG